MKLTENFNLEEFHCKDGTPVPEQYLPNLKKLAKNLQALRDELDAPVIVSGSGYRTEKHNKKAGGAPKSQHLTASAADISSPAFSPKEIAATIERLIIEGRMDEGGIGVYNTFVHYDIRGTRARWTL